MRSALRNDRKLGNKKGESHATHTGTRSTGNQRTIGDVGERQTGRWNRAAHVRNDGNERLSRYEDLEAIADYAPTRKSGKADSDLIGTRYSYNLWTLSEEAWQNACNDRDKFFLAEAA